MFRILFFACFVIQKIPRFSRFITVIVLILVGVNPLEGYNERATENGVFLYEAVRIKNGLPSEITKILRGLFNHGREITNDNKSASENNFTVDDAIRQSTEPKKEEETFYRKEPDKKRSRHRARPRAERPDNESPLIWPDDRKSLIFVRDTASRIRQIRKIIKSLDKPEAQIRIESRIVRANKDWSRGIGILWGGRNNQFGGVKTDRSSYWGITGNQSGYPANTATGANLKQTIFVNGTQQPTSRTITSSEIPSRLAVNLPASVANLGDIMGLGMQFGLLANQYITELDFRLQIGEAQGQARTVARPNIQVSDGSNAVIKSGSVLNVQTSSPQWGTNSHLVPVDLKLQVTPKILADKRIKLIITVTDNEPNPLPTTGELYLEREAHTTMTIGDGETCVIGGIIRDTVIGRREGWPGLMNLPIVGMLFSNKTKSKETDELLVFISPKVVFKPK
ncbi:MAG: secretin N-terminal domain-containing protein [Desulfomonilaceae bacterium]|jgi:type IV pilus assembly protein PilQ